MKVAYIDSSCVLSMVFGEPGHRELLANLSRYDRLFSSNLLEAETRSAIAREQGRERIGNLLSWVDWVNPYRRLTTEFEAVLHYGVLRGADLWHLACAVFLRRRIPGVMFLTLDDNQRKIAQALGFVGL